MIDLKLISFDVSEAFSSRQVMCEAALKELEDTRFLSDQQMRLAGLPIARALHLGRKELHTILKDAVFREKITTAVQPDFVGLASAEAIWLYAASLGRQSLLVNYVPPVSWLITALDRAKLNQISDFRASSTQGVGMEIKVEGVDLEANPKVFLREYSLLRNLARSFFADGIDAEKYEATVQLPRSRDSREINVSIRPINEGILPISGGYGKAPEINIWQILSGEITVTASFVVDRMNRLPMVEVVPRLAQWLGGNPYAVLTSTCKYQGAVDKIGVEARWSTVPDRDNTLLEEAQEYLEGKVRSFSSSEQTFKADLFVDLNRG